MVYDERRGDTSFRTVDRYPQKKNHDFDEKYAAAKARHEAILRSLNYQYDITELEKQWFKALDYLKQFRLIDSEHERLPTLFIHRRKSKAGLQ